MAHDEDILQNELNKFKIIRLITIVPYICDVCLEDKNAKIFNVMFTNGSFEIMQFDKNDLFFPMIKSTLEIGKFSHNIKAISCCNKCYSKLLYNVGDMMIKSNQELKN